MYIKVLNMIKIHCYFSSKPSKLVKKRKFGTISHRFIFKSERVSEKVDLLRLLHIFQIKQYCQPIDQS